MLEEVHTRKKVAHSSYTDMEQLDFQILLFDNYYIFPYLLFYENQEKTNQNSVIDADLITVNNFF